MSESLGCCLVRGGGAGSLRTSIGHPFCLALHCHVLARLLRCVFTPLRGAEPWLLPQGSSEDSQTVTLWRLLVCRQQGTPDAESAAHSLFRRGRHAGGAAPGRAGPSVGLVVPVSCSKPCLLLSADRPFLLPGATCFPGTRTARCTHAHAHVHMCTHICAHTRVTHAHVRTHLCTR